MFRRRAVHHPILQTCIIERCKRFIELTIHAPRKAPDDQLDRGEGSEGAESFGKVLEVLAETPVASEPGEGAPDRVAARQDDEALHAIARRLPISCAAAALLPQRPK
jgi:hypothetical protein